MTATASVSAPTPLKGASDTYGWDWSATTHDGRNGIVDDMVTQLGSAFVIPGKGLQGWSKSVECFDEAGYKLASVFFGEARDDVHVLATSDAAEVARRAVGTMDRARTARVDTRVDTLVPFEELQALCFDAAESYRTQLTRVESFGGKTPGRTIYLGAPSSAIRVRVYEKHLESPGQYVDGTNRVEVQLRPPSKSKEKVSGWSPAETFCASAVTTRLAHLLEHDIATPGTLHVTRGTPTLQQTMEAMGNQYGKAFRKWMDLSNEDLSTALAYFYPRP